MAEGILKLEVAWPSRSSRPSWFGSLASSMIYLNEPRTSVLGSLFMRLDVCAKRCAADNVESDLSRFLADDDFIV